MRTLLEWLSAAAVVGYILLMLNLLGVIDGSR